MASDIVGETTVCVAARSRAPFASAMCDRITTNQTSFFPNLSGSKLPGGVTARLTDSIYLYGEYDYANSDKVRIPWAVDARFRWEW